MRIYLIRHGESTSDIEDRYGGDYDDHLTKSGTDQAERLGKKLIGKNIQIIFSSPKLRAFETAKILQKSLGCVLNIIEDFRERNRYGIITGMKKSEALRKYPEQVALLNDWTGNAEKGEAYENFKKRIIESFRDITSLNYTTIVIVTHGGPVCLILRELFNMTDEVKSIGDCAVIELKQNGENLNLVNMEGVSLN